MVLDPKYIYALNSNEHNIVVCTIKGSVITCHSYKTAWNSVFNKQDLCFPA